MGDHYRLNKSSGPPIRAPVQTISVLSTRRRLDTPRIGGQRKQARVVDVSTTI